MEEQLNTQRLLPDKILVLPLTTETEVLKIRISCKCHKCGTSWGVSFLQDFTLPMGWNICRNCEDKNRKDKNENSVISGLKGDIGEANGKQN